MRLVCSDCYGVGNCSRGCPEINMNFKTLLFIYYISSAFYLTELKQRYWHQSNMSCSTSRPHRICLNTLDQI